MTQIDMEMPIDCGECKLRYFLPTIENETVYVCCATRKEVDLGWVDRPCWCPLTDGKKEKEMEPAAITEHLWAVQDWLMEHPWQYLVLNRDEDGNQWFSVKTHHGAKEIIEFEVK